MNRKTAVVLFFLFAAIVLIGSACAAPAAAPSQNAEATPLEAASTAFVTQEGAVTEITQTPAATQAPVEGPPAAAETQTTGEAQAPPQPTQAEPAAPGSQTPIAVTPTPLPISPTAPALEPLAPTATAASHLVQVEWPAEMRLGESDTVRLTLLPSEQGFLLITEYPEHETITQTLSVERPADFYLFAVARLDGPGFDISPAGEQSQFLPANSPVVWRWSLSPRRAGSQRLALSLALRWIPLQGSIAPSREITAYSKSLDVQVHSLLGLTHTQAMRTGVFSLALGAGLCGFALLLRPPRRSALRTVQPNPDLTIELPAGMRLEPEVRTLLGSLFRRYARLVIEHEFLSGYSGARTLLALPIRTDGRADAYTIAKVGESRSIRREYENFETFVKDTLPPVTARIQHPPVTVRSAAAPALAALQYTFIGTPGLPPQSLRQELFRNPDPAWLHRLMDTFGPSWWLQRRPYTFRTAFEYDRLLPSHLVIEPVEGRGASLDGRQPPARLSFQVGDVVQLRHFAAVELRADGQSFSLYGASPPGHPPLRVRWLSPRRPDHAVGRIVATRDTLLRGWVRSFDRFGLPDPLDALPALLEITQAGSRSTIHGDLNLENIIVGPGGMLWLIDFAGTRDGPTMMDFTHLASELVAHIGAASVESAQEYHRMLVDPAIISNTGLAALLQAVAEMAARCSFNPADPSEYNVALILACLGALKYNNLTPHAQHLLYLTAAHTLSRTNLTR